MNQLTSECSKNTFFILCDIFIEYKTSKYNQLQPCCLQQIIYVDDSLLTLLSLSSSFFNHSKSLYLLLTQESFNLKIGRFVYTEKENIHLNHWFIFSFISPSRVLLDCENTARWTLAAGSWLLTVKSAVKSVKPICNYLHSYLVLVNFFFPA